MLLMCYIFYVNFLLLHIQCWMEVVFDKQVLTSFLAVLWFIFIKDEAFQRAIKQNNLQDWRSTKKKETTQTTAAARKIDCLYLKGEKSNHVYLKENLFYFKILPIFAATFQLHTININYFVRDAKIWKKKVEKSLSLTDTFQHECVYFFRILFSFVLPL